MKLMTLLVLSLLFEGITLSETLTKGSKDRFVEFYRTWSKVQEEFLKRPEVIVLFFDIDFDGIEEAIATDREQFGETGYSWNIFQLKNGTWSAAKIRKINETMVDPVSGIFARTEEFYSLALIKKPLGLVVIHKDYDKLIPDGMAKPQGFSILIDQEGFVKTEKLESLDQLIGYSTEFQKLQRLGVNTL